MGNELNGVRPSVADNNIGLFDGPGGPPKAPGKGAKPEEMLQAQNESQTYWFGMNAAQNRIKQDGEAQSNMQQTAARSMDNMIGALRIG